MIIIPSFLVHAVSTPLARPRSATHRTQLHPLCSRSRDDRPLANALSPSTGCPSSLLLLMSRGAPMLQLRRCARHSPPHLTNNRALVRTLRQPRGLPAPQHLASPPTAPLLLSRAIQRPLSPESPQTRAQRPLTHATPLDLLALHETVPVSLLIPSHAPAAPPTASPRPSPSRRPSARQSHPIRMRAHRNCARPPLCAFVSHRKTSCSLAALSPRSPPLNRSLSSGVLPRSSLTRKEVSRS